MGMAWLEARNQRRWWPMVGTRRSKDGSKMGWGRGLTWAQALGDRMTGVSGKAAAVKMERQGRIGAISGAQSLYCPLGESLRDQLGGKH